MDTENQLCKICRESLTKQQIIFCHYCNEPFHVKCCCISNEFITYFINEKRGNFVCFSCHNNGVLFKATMEKHYTDMEKKFQENIQNSLSESIQNATGSIFDALKAELESYKTHVNNELQLFRQEMNMNFQKMFEEVRKSSVSTPSLIGDAAEEINGQYTEISENNLILNEHITIRNLIKEITRASLATRQETIEVKIPNPYYVPVKNAKILNGISTVDQLGVTPSVPAPIAPNAFSVPSTTSNIFGGLDTKTSSSANVTQAPASLFKVPSAPAVLSPQPNQQSSLFTTSNTTTSVIFGSPSATFNFGQGQTQIVTKPQAITTVTQPPTFGNTPATTSTFSFGAETPTASAAFGQSSIFGQTGTNTSTSNPASGGFTFKSPTTQAQSTPGGFSFNPSDNRKVSEAPKSSVFSRLGTPNVATTANPSSVVSPSKNLFTFASPVSNAQPQRNVPNATPSAFGANLSNVSNISQTSNIFGGNTTLNSPSQNSTIFGNNSTTAGNNNLFSGGQSQPKAPSSGLDQIFNSSPANNPSQFQTSTFGSNTFGQKEPFGFGSNNNSNTAARPFTFGQSSAPAASNDNKPFAFGVGSNPTPPPPAYGSQNQQEAPKFNFSAATSPFGSTGNNTAPPAFGASATPPAFNFTGANNNNNNNVFGSGASSVGPTNPGGPFNFAANQAPAQDGLSFNIGTGGGQQGRRVFRQGTRRLNK